MAFPTIGGRTSSQTTADATSHTVNFDTTPATGNLLIVAVVFDGEPTITWPADWIVLMARTEAPASGTGLCTVEIRYKVASGEGSSITLTTGASEEMEASAWRITAYAGTPEVGVAVQGTSESPDPPNLAPSWGSKDTHWIAFVGANGADNNYTSFPGSYTLNQTSQGSGGAGGVTMGCGGRNLAAASDNPTSFGENLVANNLSNTIAVRGPAGFVAKVPSLGRQAVNRASTY